MRSTVRIDDDLLQELKDRARRQNTSLTRMLNRLLRAGLRAEGSGAADKRVFVQSTFAMGAPRADLDKALGLAAELEDEEARRELSQRK